ncbi:MAG TPA: choice-of-anchor Q domain-containing protein [Polyangiaceae bacterium]
MKCSFAAVAIWAGVFSLAAASSACGDQDAREISAVGRLSVSLTARSASGVTYRLRHGIFKITGASAAKLSTETAPSAQFLQAELPSGAYLARLASGWFLEKQTTAGAFERVDAALTSANPVAFNIIDQRTTSVRFRFKAGDDVLDVGDGRLSVGIDVEESASGCRLHADCESLTCDTYAAEGRGECIDPGRVLYVGCAAAPCVEEPATGSLAAPFPRIRDAVTAAEGTAKDVIRVLPNASTLPFSVSGQRLHIIGPAGEGGDASVYEEDNGAVYVSGGADVVLDGFILGGPTHSALQCGHSRVVIRRSTLNSESSTLRGTDCDVELDRVRIAGFRSAIDFTNTRFLITNTYVGGFIEGRPAVLVQGGEGVFRFSTLAVLAEPTFGRGTLDCGTSSVLVQDSIVVGNNLFDSGSRFQGACTLERVVVGDDPIASPGAIHKTPILSDEYRLPHNAANLDCCIDRGGDEALVRWDIEGNPRPRGPRSDLGAYEVEITPP